MNAKPRHIAVVTGSRADYGLLRWLLDELAGDPAIRLTVIATGMHLAPRFGMTVDAITADGFSVERVDSLLAGDSPLAVAKSVGLGVLGMSETLDRLRPDLLVVLGDRFEILAAVQAALLLSIPVAHLHGGEVTEGAVDDAIRHAITKMSHLHFTAAEEYRRRVIQMGETPERVFNVGALGVDAALRSPVVPTAELEQALSLPLTDQTLLVTYHPVTLRPGGESVALGAMIDALDRVAPTARVIVTGVNADSGNAEVTRILENWVAGNSRRISLHTSLGQQRYLSVMRRARAVIGNSSSGLIEAPALGVPTVNIGPRQAGRLKAASVIDCGESRDEIASALVQALSADFRDSFAQSRPPYGGGNAAAAIAAALSSFPLCGLTRKSFHSLENPA